MAGEDSTILCSVNESSEKVENDKHNGKQRRKWKFRSIGSSRVLLILIWYFIICCSLELTLHQMQYFQSLENQDNESIPLWMVKSLPLLCMATLSISCPVASLLAEVVMSRYKLVSYCLKAIWLLSVVSAIVSICEDSLPKHGLYTITLFVIVIPQCLILGAFLASAVPLGIDQITGGSNNNISAFIQWFVWVNYCGLAAPLIVGSVLYSIISKVSMIISLLPVLLLSVGLILDFCFHHKLVKEPVTVNPVSLMFKVLKYAAKHKYPVQRSAFTYCENERPTRLDYGKSKYGGPFTTEQVEDVKTFWRILLVIVVLSSLHVSLMLVYESAFVRKGGIESESKWIKSVVYVIISPTLTIIYFIPLYELLVYPCLKNRSPSILQSAGIGAAALVCLSIFGITAEITKYYTSTKSDSMFSWKDPDINTVYFFIGIPFNCALGYTRVILLKSILEFICAQAPYNMKGLLIGFFFTIQTMFITVGGVIYMAWSNNWFAILDTSTCGIWFYLTTLVLAVVSSALLGLVIRWYKARERDEITRSQDLVEEVYHKYQEQAS